MTSTQHPTGFVAAHLVEDAGDVALQRAADGAILHFSKGKNNPSLGAKMVNRTVDPLDWYLHRKQISNEQHDAGDWLRRLHYIAYGSGYTKVNLGGVHGVADYTQNWNFTGKAARAMRTISDFMHALPEAERVVLDRVIHWGDYANKVAHGLGLSERQGIAILRSALSHIDQWRNDGLPRKKDSGEKAGAQGHENGRAESSRPSGRS
jgi:hypothetical protein